MRTFLSRLKACLAPPPPHSWYERRVRNLVEKQRRAHTHHARTVEALSQLWLALRKAGITEVADAHAWPTDDKIEIGVYTSSQFNTVTLRQALTLALKLNDGAAEFEPAWDGKRVDMVLSGWSDVFGCDVTIKARDVRPGDGCEIVEETVEVPATTEVKRRVVCR